MGVSENMKNTNTMRMITMITMLPLMSTLIIACNDTTIRPHHIVRENPINSSVQKNNDTGNMVDENNDVSTIPVDANTTIEDNPVNTVFLGDQAYNFSDYNEIDYIDCTLDGFRSPNSYMDIGYGDRNYYGFTNEHSQLVYVYAENIVLQDDSSEKVNSDGRYCSSMAQVPGVESSNYDRGHVIADSLGGTSSAYNITPQESTLNRHGDQAYMERMIRDAGGAQNFRAYITYPNENTHIPSHYDFYYTINGNEIHDSFANGNPDVINEELGVYSDQTVPDQSNQNHNTDDISAIDKNGNGKVTIQEAKDAGFTMPITSDHWLYKYMTDGNNNGMVGE